MLNNVLPLLYKYKWVLFTFVSVCVNLWLFSRTPETKTVTETVYRDKIVKEVEEKVVFKDRIQYKTRVITKKGDETRVEETTTTGESSELGSIRQVETKESERKQTKTVVTQSTQTNYLLGVSRNLSTGDYRGSFQFRVLPSVDLFVGPEVTLQNKKFSLGVGITLGL